MDVVVFLLAFFGTGVTAVGKELCLVVLGPYPDASGTVGLLPAWDGGPGLIPAARLAAEVINNRTDVLPAYTLRLLEGDSGCDVESKAVISLVQSVFHRSATVGCLAVGIVGPACTGATIVVGGLLAGEATSLLHVSPSATSPELIKSDLYPNTYRLLSSSVEYVSVYRELMLHNGWDTVAALYDSTRKYFLSTFHEFYDTVNISYFSPVSENNIPLGDIYLSYRVIFMFVGAELARNILCLAYQFQPTLSYPVYQWIFHDRTIDQLWQDVAFSYAGKGYSCSKHQMMQATDGVILNLYRLKRENALAETDVGLTLQDFQSAYQQKLSDHLKEVGLTRDQYTPTAEDWAPLYYDAVWTMALSLTRAEHDLLLQENLTLTEYKYGNPRATALIRRQLSLLDFEGLSGRISFRNETHDTATIVDLYQIVYNTSSAASNSSLIGSYGPDGLVILPSAEFVPCSFELVQQYVHPVVTVVFLALVLLCTGFLVSLHILYICYFDTTPIRASSPRLSQLIFSGCYLVMFLAFILILITSKWVVTLFHPLSRNHFIVYSVFCYVANWNISTGYTLILSTLVVQLWRIYIIFNHFQKKLRFLSDEFLVCVVGGILVVNCVVKLCWILTDPPLDLFRLTDVVQSYDGSQQPVLLLEFGCHSETVTIFDSIVIAIQVILGMSLVVLSILNRHIQKRNYTNSGVNVFVYISNVTGFFANVFATLVGTTTLLFVVIVWETFLLSSILIVSAFLFLPRVRLALAFHAHKQID